MSSQQEMLLGLVPENNNFLHYVQIHSIFLPSQQLKDIASAPLLPNFKTILTTISIPYYRQQIYMFVCYTYFFADAKILILF